MERKVMKATYTLRLPKELRDKIREEAKISKMSINQYILYTLTKDISYKEAERLLKSRIRRSSSRKEALNLLDKIVPDVPPLPQDDLPEMR
jgi:predicted HicB family RNase H-like nuclease